MSNARNLADVISGNYDVPAGSLDNVDLSSRVAKTGDTMTGNLTVDGSVVVNGATTNTNSNWGYFINPKSGGAVGDFTVTRPDGNVSWLAIDSAGRVTMPYQPMFKAYMGSSFSYEGGVGPRKHVGIDTIQFNVGNSFNTSTQRFFAPVSGYYHFYGQVYFGSVGDGYYGASVYVNGVSQNSFIYFRGGYGDASATVTNIQYLAEGDYAELWYYCAGSSTRSGSISTYLSGYLIG